MQNRWPVAFSRKESRVGRGWEREGIIYLILVVAAAQFYANPPAGWEPRTKVAKAASTYDYTVGEAMRTWQFWLLWLMLFFNHSVSEYNVRS